MDDTPNVVTTPDPGIYPGTLMSVYHAWKAASNSRLCKLQHSPAHLKAYLEEKEEDTAATRFGRAAHTAILEPDNFSLEFTVAGQCEATVASGKNAGAQCQNSGIIFVRGGWMCGVHGKGLFSDDTRTVLSADDYAACLGVRDSVHAHRSAHGLLSGHGDVELSILWNDAETGVLCKARPDKHSPLLAGGCIPDIKTCTDASRRAFERSIFTFGYHIKGALYLDGANAVGIPAKHFVLIAVEKTKPYGVAVYRLLDEVIATGATQVDVLLRQYAECEAKNEWPAYSQDVQDIGLPRFAYDVIDEQLAAATA